MKLKNVSMANILLNVEVKKNKKTTVESQYLPAGGEVVELPDYFMCDYLKFLISEGRVIKLEDEKPKAEVEKADEEAAE